MHHNAELRAVRDEVVSRTVPEVVRFYGHWKRCLFLTSVTISRSTQPIFLSKPKTRGTA